MLLTRNWRLARQAGYIEGREPVVPRLPRSNRAVVELGGSSGGPTRKLELHVGSGSFWRCSRALANACSSLSLSPNPALHTPQAWLSMKANVALKSSLSGLAEQRPSASWRDTRSLLERLGTPCLEMP